MVKVELIRALLSGTRALVVDPDGEYAAIMAALGGEVIPVSPGTRTGIDPVALTDTSPGALDTRIATVTTFISLLAGQVRPRQRGSIEDAIALVYARSGFADGITSKGLTAPRLIDVQARLRVTAGLEDVWLRPRRFIPRPAPGLIPASHPPPPRPPPPIV